MLICSTKEALTPGRSTDKPPASTAPWPLLCAAAGTSAQTSAALALSSCTARQGAQSQGLLALQVPAKLSLCLARFLLPGRGQRIPQQQGQGLVSLMFV